MQHLENTKCQPYLLYGAEAINWNRSAISSIAYSLNCVICRVNNVSFQSQADMFVYWSIGYDLTCVCVCVFVTCVLSVYICLPLFFGYGCSVE